VAAIHSLRDSIPVHAAHGGSIVEWLADDGDLVSPGQPLIRLHPQVQS
jgi:[acyl-carrier-protein] S-malonyltransferase